MSGRTDTRKKLRREAEKLTVGQLPVELIAKDPKKKPGEVGATIILEPYCTKAVYKRLKKEAKEKRRCS